METILKEVSVQDIELDDDNPRLRFSKIEKGIKKWTQEELEEEIKESLVFNRLLDSIKQYGVIDPVWLHQIDKRRYKVIEGNMRVTALRFLSGNGLSPPQGAKYDLVKAHVLPKNTARIQIEVQKAVLQTGKNPWGAFNEAAHIFDLHTKHRLKIEKIADMLGKSKSYVRNEIENFQFYLEFIKFRQHKGDSSVDPKKYSFFKDAPPIIRERFFKNRRARNDYFVLISPNKAGIIRIPSVSLKGGLRTFAKFVEDEKILSKFMKNTKMSVDDGYFEFTEKNFVSKQPWVKKISSVIKGLQGLSRSERSKLKDNPEVLRELKKLSTQLKKFV